MTFCSIYVDLFLAVEKLYALDSILRDFNFLTNIYYVFFFLLINIINLNKYFIIKNIYKNILS